MRIYLDNCCYNRPYDDQSQMRISLETQAKLYVQRLVREKKIELAASYVLDYENSDNPYEMRKNSIAEFITTETAIYVDVSHHEELSAKVAEIMDTVIKYKDACHVACAIYAKCDFFISTDVRLLKYKSDEIEMLNPIDFLGKLEVESYE